MFCSKIRVIYLYIIGVSASSLGAAKQSLSLVAGASHKTNTRELD